MKIYNQIITPSLLDFEEIKFIFANENFNLVKINRIKSTYYVKDNIDFLTSKYNSIMSNNYVIEDNNDYYSLIYRSKDSDYIKESRLEINNIVDTIDFLNHKGYKELFSYDKDVYSYSNDKYEIEIINLINIGLYLCIRGNETNNDLVGRLMSFKLPFKEDNIKIELEKLVIDKLRRQIKNGREE